MPACGAESGKSRARHQRDGEFLLHTALRWTGNALHRLERTQALPFPVEQVFDFFADASNLEAITPPWLRFRILTRQPIAMGEGTLIDYRLSLHGLSLRWRTEIVVWEPGRRFVDRQLTGPYRFWEHTHTFEQHEDGTLMRDVVVYRLPLGRLGVLANRVVVESDLQRIFDHRREAIGRQLGQAAPSLGNAYPRAR